MASISDTQSLSRRGQEAARSILPVFLDVISDSYAAETNPSGIVCLGLAENVLMHQEMEDYIAALHLRISSHDLTYGDDFSGGKHLRAALSRFINKHFHPLIPATPAHLAVTAGVTNAIEVMAWTLGDPGDGILLGRPFYSAFVADMGVRAEINTVTVSFGKVDPFSKEAVHEYERALLKSNECGNPIRALMLCSPHNPLGRCYPRDTLIALMRFCQKYQLHLISDEIYALSVWKNAEHLSAPQFTSVLSIPLEGIIDSRLVHVLWGMSKDFGANGLRLGCIISQNNPALLASLRPISLFTCPSAAAGNIATHILEDDAFTENYIAKNCLRIAESYSFVVDFLRSHSIPFYPGSNAAFFIWCNLRAYLLSKKEEVGQKGIPHNNPEAAAIDDQAIMQKLLASKVFIACGAEFGGEEPGWYRIVFTHPKPYLEEGLKRMIEALA